MRWFAIPLLLALPLPLTPGDRWDPSWEHWRDYLVPPRAEETWLDVDWRASFWDGMREAQAERKPVLLWAMNGHPLGCT